MTNLGSILKSRDITKKVLSRQNFGFSSGHVCIEGNGNPLQCSCLENPVDRGAWRAAVHRVARSRIRLKRLSVHACIGEGNGNPFQYFCLENPRDKGAWWAAIFGVTQSRTRLKRLSSSSSIRQGSTKKCIMGNESIDNFLGTNCTAYNVWNMCIKTFYPHTFNPGKARHFFDLTVLPMQHKW